MASSDPFVFTVYVPRTLVSGERIRDVKPAPGGPFGGAAAWWTTDRSASR